MRAWLASMVVALSCVVGAAAHAATLNSVSVGDLPGTHGRWQSGEVTVSAPASEVQRWFSDVPRWPQRFPDDIWARETGRTPDGRKLADLRSRAIGRTLHLQLTERPGFISYVGKGKGVSTQGRIYIQSLGPNTTRIILQTTGELHGMSVLAGEGTKRKRAIKKLSSDLNAAVRLADQYAATRRRGG